MEFDKFAKAFIVLEICPSSLQSLLRLLQSAFAAAVRLWSDPYPLLHFKTLFIELFGGFGQCCASFGIGIAEFILSIVGEVALENVYPQEPPGPGVEVAPDRAPYEG